MKIQLKVSLNHGQQDIDQQLNKIKKKILSQKKSIIKVQPAKYTSLHHQKKPIKFEASSGSSQSSESLSQQNLDSSSESSQIQQLYSYSSSPPQQQVQNYFQTVRKLQTLNIPEKQRKHLNEFSYYLHSISCIVCKRPYDFVKYKPMICCKVKHKICSNCYEQNQFKLIPMKCSLCQEPIGLVRRDEEFIQWLRLTQKLKITIPKSVISELDPSVHQSFRKFAIHQFYNLQRTNTILSKRESQQKLLRLKLLSNKLTSIVQQKQTKIQELQRKIKALQKSFAFNKQQQRTLNEQITILLNHINKLEQSKEKLMSDVQIYEYRTLPNTVFKYKDTQQLIEHYQRAKNIIQPIFVQLEKLNDRYEQSIQKTLISHELQCHQGHNIYRLGWGNFYDLNSKKKVTPYINPPKLKIDRCEQCDILSQVKREQLLQLDQQRQKLLRSLHESVKDRMYEVVRGFIDFTPNRNELNEMDEYRFRNINSKQTELMEKIMLEEKIDIQEFRNQLAKNKNTHDKNSSSYKVKQQVGSEEDYNLAYSEKSIKHKNHNKLKK